MAHKTHRPFTFEDQKRMVALWPHYSLCDIGKAMNRDKSLIRKWGIKLDMPMKSRSYRKKQGEYKDHDRAKNAAVVVDLRGAGQTWDKIAAHIGLSASTARALWLSHAQAA